MLESAHPLFLALGGMVFGVQAIWGFMSGRYLRRDGWFGLAVVSKEDRPIEFVAVNSVYALVALVASGALILKV
jgi:hypothetical protein